MNKLSKDKRNQLILIALATVMVISMLWFGLIRYQKAKLADVARKINSTQQEIEKDQKVARGAAQIEVSLKEANHKLAAIEDTMPSGDLFYWFISHIKQFNAPSYKVDMPQFGLPSVAEVPMFPNFPYHQVSISVGGTAYYYDIGKFLSDFENHFPYGRLQNLSLEPVGGGTPDDKEKLAFHMEIVVLLKPSNS